MRPPERLPKITKYQIFAQADDFIPFSLREIKKYAILLLCRQVGPTRRLPPQGRTEAEVVKMTNVELFNSLLTVIGIIVSAVSLGITLSHR